MSEITRVLRKIEEGDPEAAAELLPLVYEELRRYASYRLSREKPGQTLQTTALVHEAYLRLVGPREQTWEGRAHFFAAAAEAMRRILVESARRKARLKHGGGQQRMDVDDVEVAVLPPSEDILALNEALDRLAEEHPEKAKLVKLRYFAGLTIDQTAQILRISHATAERHWKFARAWLYEAIHQ